MGIWSKDIYTRYTFSVNTHRRGNHVCPQEKVHEEIDDFPIAMFVECKAWNELSPQKIDWKFHQIWSLIDTQVMLDAIFHKPLLE